MIQRIAVFAVSASLLCPSPAFSAVLRASLPAPASPAPLVVAPSAIAPVSAPALGLAAPLRLVPAPVAPVVAVAPLAVAPAAPVAARAQAEAVASGLVRPEARPGEVLTRAFDGGLSAASTNEPVFAAGAHAPANSPLAASDRRPLRGYAAAVATTALPASTAAKASALGLSTGWGFAILGASIVGLLLAVRWIEGSLAFQGYLAKRRWIAAHDKKWSEATDAEKAMVAAEAERIVALNKAGRANRWSEVFGKRRGAGERQETESRRPDSQEPSRFDPTPVQPSRPPRLARDSDKRPEPSKGITFAEVAGQDEAKRELRKVVDFLKNPERYKKLGAKGFKGVLLFGPPGTGKTLMARAVAGEANATFVDAKGSDFVNKYVGVGPDNIRKIFSQARGDGKKPGILFIDEIDAVGKKRSDGDGNQEYENTLNALLAEMSAEHNANVVVMAATNRPELLDAALMRGRRFGLKVPVGLPDVEGREAILKVHAKGMPMEEEGILRKVAELTPRLSGADLEEIINDAAMLAAERNAEAVSLADFRRAVDRQTIGHERKLAMSDAEKRVVAYHESGHALTAWLLPNADAIRKITIVPHGLQALGLVQTVSEEERFMYSKSWLEDRIAVALGGRIAEELTQGEIYSGAQNDLEQATRIARMMVMKFGMSGRVGHVSYDMDGERPTVGRAMSERQRRIIDEEVRRILDEQTARVRRLLTENREVLESLSRALIEKETLREKDLDGLLPPRPAAK